MQQPTIGRIVLYKLNEYDVEPINRRRQKQQDDNWPQGAQAHTGNAVKEGDVFPAMVVAKFSPDMVNLQVFLDGNDQYWATSRKQGDENGQWNWPVITGGAYAAPEVNNG